MTIMTFKPRKEYEYPICENCGNEIPRGWDNWRNKPEVPSHHKQRKTCSPECQSQHMEKVTEKVWRLRKYGK